MKSNVNAFMNGYFPNEMEPNGPVQLKGNIQEKPFYVLTEDGITFYQDGDIFFDLPAERITTNPEDAIEALYLIEKCWRGKRLERG